MKKRLVCTVILVFFVIVLVFSIEETEIKPEIEAIPSIPGQVEKLTEFWNLYFSSGEVTSFEHYIQNFIEFIDVDNYTYDKQAYVISEILFYTMFASQFNKDAANSLDDSITTITSYIHQGEEILPASVNSMRLFSFLAQKTKNYLPVNEPEIFKISDYDSPLQMISSIYNDTPTILLYDSYTAVEGMYQRFEKARSLHQQANAFNLSENAFYRVLNNPLFVYVILFDAKYVNLLNSFIRSCTAYLEINELDVKNIFLSRVDGNFTVFPQNIFTQLYSKVPQEHTQSYASLVYAASDLLYDLEKNSMLYGYPIDIFFTSNEFQILLAINLSPFYIHSLSEDDLLSLCNSLVFASAAPLYVKRVNDLLVGSPSKGGF